MVTSMNHLYTISNTNTSNETAPVITSNINNNHDGIQHSLTHRNDDAPPVVQEAWTESRDDTSVHIPQPGPQVVVQQPTPIGPRFRDVPVIMTDRNGVPFTTELRYVNGLFTWVLVGIICLIGSSFCCPWLGLLPLCIRELKDIEHINTDTGRVVGRFDRAASFGF